MGYGHSVLTEKFLKAAEENNAAEAERYLNDGAHINASDKHGATALIWAAHHGNADFVDMLVSRGAERECTDNSGNTPLIMALRRHHADLARHMVTLQFNIAARDERGAAPLHFAAELNDVKLIGELLRAGAPLEAKGLSGMTPLIVAACLGKTEAVFALLSAGANIDAQDDADGRTALMYAVTTSRYQLIGDLVRKGANVSICDNRGCTAMDLAHRWNVPEINNQLEGTFVATVLELLRDGTNTPIVTGPALKLKPRVP